MFLMSAFVLIYLQQWCFLFFLQINNIIVKIKNNPKTTANTIIAAKASKNVPANDAPNIIPITVVNAASNIVAIIPKQFFLFS